LGDLAGRELVGLLEGGLVEGPREHGVLDGAVLHREGGNLHASAHLVLPGHLQAQATRTAQLLIGQGGFLGKDFGGFLGLESPTVLLSPASALLCNRFVEALPDDTAFLAVVIIDSGMRVLLVDAGVFGPEGFSSFLQIHSGSAARSFLDPRLIGI